MKNWPRGPPSSLSICWIAMGVLNASTESCSLVSSVSVSCVVNCLAQLYRVTDVECFER